MKNKKVDNNNTPVSQLKNFINEIKQNEKERQPFYNYFDELQKDFYVFLKTKYDKQTAFNNKEIIGMLKLYLTWNTKVENIETITKEMVGKDFFDWFNKNSHEKLSENKLKKTLKIFFQFLKDNRGIVNQKVLDFL